MDESFLQMEQATYADGALPKKTKELIAIGVSVAMDCESCMQWPIDQAAGCGATEQEVLEAVEVGIEMAAGRATVWCALRSMLWSGLSPVGFRIL